MRKFYMLILTVCLASASALAQVCNTPANADVSAITDVSASVSFTAAGNNFIVEYGPIGFTPGTDATPGIGGTIVTGTSSPISISGLVPNTSYNVFVREVCAGPVYSSNSAVIAFTTDCSPITPVYTQDFTSYIPNCWKEQTGVLRNTGTTLAGTASLWEEGIWLNSIANASPVVNLYSSGKHEWLVSPSIDLGNSGNYQLEFDLATLKFLDILPSALGSDDSLALVISTDNGVTWTTSNIIGLWTAANTPVTTTGLHVSIPLTSYTGIVKFGFYATDGTNSDAENVDVMIDNFSIVSCAAPTAVSVGSITSTSASVSFSGAGSSFIVEYGPVGFTPGTGLTAGTNGTIQTGSGSPIALSGLTVGGTYDVYVRRDCGANGLSANSGPVLFSTICTSTNVPYLETFDAVTTPMVPACIIVENTGNNTETWKTHGLLDASPDIPASAGNFIRLDYEQDLTTPADDWFFTRGLNLTGGTSYRLRFHLRNSDDDVYIESLEVKYGTSANASAMTLGTLYSNPAVDTNAWFEAYVDFIPASSGIYYIGFHGNSPADQAFLCLDNINVIQTPACEPPPGISISSVTGSSAVISFSSPGTSFIVEYGPTGFTPGTGSSAGGGLIVTGTSSPINITGLTGATMYDVYVRRDCGGGSFSPNTLPLSFLTGPPNDDAPGAFTVTVDAACSGNGYTNAAATQSVNEPFASCEGTQGYHSVWYKFVAPVGGAVKVSNDFAGSGLGDSRLAVFSATNVNDYSTFTILGCDDDNGVVDGSKSIVYLAGLTPGTTYYVQVDVYDAANIQGNFCLEVSTLTSSMIAANASCGSSQNYSNLNTTYAGWVSMVDASGNIIANVKQKAGTATNITASYTVNTGANRTDNTVDRFYLNRNYLLDASGATSTDVQFFFLDAELTSLQASDAAVTANNLGATQQSGTTCQPDFVAANGTNTYLVQTGNGSINGVRWINVSTQSLSNFYLHTSKAAMPVKVFLQGAFSTGLARHKDVTAQWALALNNNALSQPFNAVGFGSYAGTESVAPSSFTSNNAVTTDVTDWVLVELRNASTPATVITRRAAFVLENGQIVDLDKTTPVSFRGMATGNYFIVVRHRNHLGIRSSVVEAANGSLGAAPSNLYDFTTAQSKAFQNTSTAPIPAQPAMRDLNSGTVFAMWGGNTNAATTTGNTTVRATGALGINDYQFFFNTLGGNASTVLGSALAPVYNPADVNLDGVVRATGALGINDYSVFLNFLGGNSLTIYTQHQ